MQIYDIINKIRKWLNYDKIKIVSAAKEIDEETYCRPILTTLEFRSQNFWLSSTHLS